LLLAFAVGCATSDPPARKTKTPAPAEEGSAGESAGESADAPMPHREGPTRAAPPPAQAAQEEKDTKEAKGPPASSADAGASAEEPQKRTAANPFGDVGFKEVNTKDWLAALREKIAQQEKVPPTDLRVSPGLLRTAYVRSPPVVPVKPGRRAPLRRHDVVVVDNQGRRVASFRAVAAKRGDEPPRDLRFLSEDRLVYEVVEPPPEPPPPGKPAPRKKPPKPTHAKKTAPKPAKAAAPKVAVAPPPRPVPPLPPARMFVIQPIAPRARPIKCVGVHFTFSHDKDKLAFVSGTAEAGFVAVDGAQVYPRRGRTMVASAPAWSKDGRSLAFLEARAAQPARLVLLAELDNPTGDTTWDLPPTANTDGVLVFWAGSGKLVVGKTQMRPVFSASFTKESPGR
jgi:hypothetical protein